jgi:Family of unknown function (DUF5691)
MHDPILMTSIERLVARWLVGGDAPAVTDVPAEWRDALLPDDELALLAMATQARQYVLAPIVPASAQPGHALPMPTLALLPDPLRLRFRRLVRTVPAPTLGALLHMLAARGWMAHPFDWRPQPDHDELPEVYAPLRAWEAAQRAPRRSAGDHDDWDALLPSERRRLLQRLRAEDPAAARERLATGLAGLSAEHRLPLVETLAIGLGADDLPLLESLASDRSEKVRQAVARLRARLGLRVALAPEEEAEVRAWFDVGRTGLIQRRTKVTLTPLKTRPQHAARCARLAQLGWSDLCALLGLDADALADAWTLADDDDHAVFVCAAQTAPDGTALALLRRVLSGALALPMTAEVQSAIEAIVTRLSDAARADLMREQLDGAGVFDGYAALLALMPGPLSDIATDLRRLQRSPRWRGYDQARERHLADGGGANTRFAQDTAALSALLSHAAAQALLRALVDAGIPPGDPALDALHLNVESPPGAAPAPPIHAASMQVASHPFPGDSP